MMAHSLRSQRRTGLDGRAVASGTEELVSFVGSVAVERHVGTNRSREWRERMAPFRTPPT
ncbi:hypothetical protein Sj15T_05440 [Sphingobium sp. TA15]|nr:hypothetical protein Sj15T_05440 [Sphingobium sp. TA15]